MEWYEVVAIAIYVICFFAGGYLVYLYSDTPRADDLLDGATVSFLIVLGALVGPLIVLFALLSQLIYRVEFYFDSRRQKKLRKETKGCWPSNP